MGIRHLGHVTLEEADAQLTILKTVSTIEISSRNPSHVNVGPSGQFGYNTR